MNILIDTHIALWSMYNDKRLNERSREYLLDEDNVIFVSLISAWEIAIKYSIGKMTVPADGFLKDCEEMGYQLLPMKKQHIAAVQNMAFGPDGHKDPFDRMLIAQAESERMRLLTEDRKILGYDSSVIIK